MEKENVPQEARKALQFSYQLPVPFKNLNAKAALVPSKHTAPHRHLLMRHASDALDAQLDDWSERVIGGLKLNPMDLYPPNLPSAEMVWCVGRLIQISGHADWWLETSRQVGSGVRVPLDLKALKEWSLFTGQLVCLKGINPDGRLFRVQEVFEIPTASTVSTQVDRQVTKVCVMFGPFGEDAFERLKVDSTWTVVVGGPLVDAVDALPSQQWAKMLARLQKLASHVESLVLIPSLDDAGHDHVFPQCQYHSLPANALVMAGNPCILQKGDFKACFSTLDVLHRMSTRLQESHPQPDRLQRMANLIVTQSSWYPWDPPLEHDPVDRCRWEDLQIPLDTHLVMAPSRLKPMASVGQGKLFVNPGKGTPCYLEIHSDGTIKTQ